MKNQHIERLRAAAKRRGKSIKQRSTWNHDLQIDVRHIYCDKRELSYWDDVAFVNGKQQVTVFWTHPRYLYRENIDQRVYEGLEKPVFEPFRTGEPVHRAIGKTGKRKRTVAWRSTCKPNPESSKFYANWRATTDAECLTSDFLQRCSFKITQLWYGRGVEICCPMEVRNEVELAALANFVRACLADHTLFARTYGDYAYTSADYVREQCKE